MVAPLRPLSRDEVAARLTDSLFAPGSHFPDTAEVHDWLAGLSRRTWMKTRRAGLDELTGWVREPDTGFLRHHTGRFFSVEAVSVERDDAVVASWRQPIINQPEIGILGILVKEIDGVLHCLVQAKQEPGNPGGGLQLSPTVQATRSNYTGVHKGRSIPYLRYFREPAGHRVLVDIRQSEQGAWFYRKRNRNMVVEVSGDVAPHADFRWLTLGQIAELLHCDNLVNMDARSVLAGLPVAGTPHALHSDTDLLSWLVTMRSAHTVRTERVPLADVSGWAWGPASIDQKDGRYFRVVAVAVQAGNREVSHWTQPLFEPRGEGIVAFLTREIEGVAHVLVRARPEAGFLDTVEIGPTVQHTPANSAHLPSTERPAFLDVVSAPDPARIRYSALHSEEGGRFLNAVSRYLVIEAEEEWAPLDPPFGFRWVSHAQLCELARHGHYVSVQARTLLTCLNAGAAQPHLAGA